MGLDLVIDGLVAGLLAVTCVYCVLLDRKLRAVRGAQTDMRRLVDGLDAAAGKARASLDAIRTEGVATGERLKSQMAAAQSLHEELSMMVDTADRVADRMEAASRGGSESAAHRLRAFSAAARERNAAPSPFDESEEYDKEHEDPQAVYFGETTAADIRNRVRAALGGVR